MTPLISIAPEMALKVNDRIRHHGSQKRHSRCWETTFSGFENDNLENWNWASGGFWAGIVAANLTENAPIEFEQTG